MTAAILAPADPIGTVVGPQPLGHRGHERRRPAPAHHHAGAVRHRSQRGRVASAQHHPDGRKGHRPHHRAPSTASATWTAQSSRPSEYSRVPSRGSTIHTRPADVPEGHELLGLLGADPVVGELLGQAGHEQTGARRGHPRRPRALPASVLARSVHEHEPASPARSAATRCSSPNTRRPPLPLLPERPGRSARPDSIGIRSGRNRCRRPAGSAPGQALDHGARRLRCTHGSPAMTADELQDVPDRRLPRGPGPLRRRGDHRRPPCGCASRSARPTAAPGARWPAPP